MRAWRPKEALSSFSSPPNPTRIPALQLNRLLQKCSNSKAVAPGKQVHQHILVRGSGRDPFVITKLVQMYAECDDFSCARKLFDHLSQPNVFAWTAILSLYSRNGFAHKCIRSYAEMKEKGIVPDRYVFPKVLRACAQLSSLEAGCRVHRDVIICGSGFNVEVCNALIDMYSKCGDVERARRVFDLMVERNILSWNLMISAYVSNGFFGLAVELFGLMRLERFEPDVITLNTAMDAFSRMGLMDEAWDIFEQIDEPNIISFSTVISGYSRIEKHDVALLIFGEMMRRGRVAPDLDSLARVLVSARHLGVLSRGREVHAYGIKLNSRNAFYDSVGAALLTMYAKCGRSREARNVFELLDRSDVVSWNAMIFGFLDLGFEHQALECFREMQNKGIKSDSITVSTVLPACDLKSVKEVHAYMSRNGFYSITLVWNALINMYAKCGCIGAAYSLFSKMVVKDIVSWNTMIAGFGMHGLGQGAIQILKEMSDSGLRPNFVTFTSILSACSHSGLVDEGMKLFDNMTKDYGFTPTMEHFACIVNLLARAGRLEDAVDFIKKMPTEPDRAIWGAMLAASQDQQNVAVGKLAAEHLFHLEPKHAGNYVTLSNIYAKAGVWDESVKVRKVMEDRGLVKPLGYSWIEGSN